MAVLAKPDPQGGGTFLEPDKFLMPKEGFKVTQRAASARGCASQVRVIGRIVEMGRMQCRGGSVCDEVVNVGGASGQLFRILGHPRCALALMTQREHLPHGPCPRRFL